MTELKKTTVKAVLDGKEIVIKKLKAGKYYQAQQIYVGMIDKLNQAKSQGKSSNSKEDDKPSEEVLIGVAKLYSIVPQEVAKLVAFCIGEEVDKLLEKAFPEELADLSEKVIELNNFNENLKNSVAPMGNLGAEKL